MKRASSGSEQDDRYALTNDDKKKRRMISNRESARRSRMKRSQHMKDLNDQVLYFETKKNEMILKINKLNQVHEIIEAENMIMEAQKQELTKRLEYTEILISYVGETSGVHVGVNQDPWIRPWQHQMQQLPCPLPASSSFDNFHLEIYTNLSR